MANLVFTAANVIPAAGTKKQPGIAGEVLNVGDAICLNPADKNRVYQYTADDAVNTFRQVLAGFNLSPAAAAGQPTQYAYADGDIIGVGAILEPGMWYMGAAKGASSARGKICPIIDMSIFGIKTTQIASNIATFTTFIAHPFLTGQTILIAGSSNSFYNGSLLVASTPTATTFTVAITHANDGPNTEASATAQLKGIIANILGVAQTTSNLQIVKRNTTISR